MKKKFFLTFTISIVVFTMLYMSLWDNIFDKEIVAAPNTDGEIGEVIEEIKQKVKNEVLFLLMGVDSKDVKKSEGTRTDTMMLFKVNFETGKIDLLSLPRDTRVLVRGKEDKLNHAHAYGGPELTIKTVRDFLEIDLDYFVKVDYKIVSDTVDAIGGVEIDVPQRMYYNDPTSNPPLHINLQKGPQLLLGPDAHDFLRYRSGYANGDLGRIDAQQYFMKELIKQTLKPKNIFKLPKLAETFFENVETNIPLNLVLKGISFANNMDVEEMNSNVIPGKVGNIGGLSYLIYDREETKIIVSEMFGNYLLY